MRLFKSLFLVAILAILCFADAVAARGFRRAYFRSPSIRTARPATGYGANLHRNFILKQEAKRALHGKRVRNRGNILWYR